MPRAVRCTPQEDDLMFLHYKEMGSVELAKLMPGRTPNAIQNHAKLLGLASETRPAIDVGTDKAMKEAQAEMIEGLSHLLPTVCGGDPQKVQQAFALLKQIQRNSAAWWWRRRHMPLGVLAESFVKGYTFKPKDITRDDFLDETGCFAGSIDHDVYPVGLETFQWTR